jgi:hypothetical protein
MSTSETPSNPPAFNFQQWFARLGTSGKLLAIGGAAGVIAVFLPLISVTIDMMGVTAGSHSSMVLDSWQGKICLAGYLGAIVSAFLLYPAPGAARKVPAWLGLAVGGVVALCAFWILISVLRATGGASDFMGKGGAKVSPGFGTFLNVLTAAAVAAGGFLKAREERLF